MRSLHWTGALALVVAVVACGSSGDGSGFGSSGTSGSGTGPGATGTSGSLGGSSGDLGDGGPGSSGGPGGNCSGQVDMFIVFDRSNSMGDDCDIGKTTNSKWCHAVNALSGYFNSQGAAGQAAALQYFPLKTHTDALCTTGTGYDVPEVPTDPATEFQTLPSNAFDSSLNAAGPGLGLGTPTEAAIRGISTFTTNHRRGGRVTIGVLITDGDPNGCDNKLDDLSKLLDDHYQQTKSRTYVIGMDGATFKNLEQIAVGGNAPTHPDTVGAVTHSCGSGLTPPCRSWNVGDGDPAVFAAALAAIQESADGCKEGGGFINPVK